MKSYYINFGREKIYECGATLVSLLAYPEDDENDSKRLELHASLCALSLRAEHEGSDDDAIPKIMKPIHALRTDDEIELGLKTHKRRLRDRMIAARMVIPFLQEVQNNAPPPLPAGTKRLSINAMATLALDDAEQSDPEKVETRIWRPSLPVIHLAAATQVYLTLAQKENTDPPHIGHLLLSRPAIEYIVEEAERYEILLANSCKLIIDMNKLVKLRLANN
jgi:hypothetical protein